MKELFRRIRYLLNRHRIDRELADEMDVHREMAARDGGSPFGNTLRLREEARDAWGWTWMDRLGQDVRYAARASRKSPGFTIVAVLMLALGIGVNVAAFGFFNVMVLRPLPVRDPDTLLRFLRSAPEGFSDNMPYAAVAFYRQHSKALSAVLAVNFARLSIEGGEKPLDAHFVTANFFTELGATPRIGMTLDPARDEASDAEPVVVLSHGFWQRQFGGDPLVVGKTINLNSKPVTVIGVAASGFSGLSLSSPDLWVPMTKRPYVVNGGQSLRDISGRGVHVLMWGRLQPGLSASVAEEELRSLTAELRKVHPNDIQEDERLLSEPGAYATGATGGRRGGVNAVFALLGALGLLILAVACANLGSLLLARGVARQQEMAIRAAIGAGRSRLVRQLFTESLLLAFVGSVAGLALGYLVLRTLMAWTEAARLNPVPDWRVVLFAIGVGFVAAILFGLTPALQAGRQRLRTTITRQVLIAAQVAASCVLLIVAGLLVRALERALFTHPGFDYQQVISLDPRLHGHDYSPASARVYLDALGSRLRDHPGVDSVSMATNPPLGNRWTVRKADVAGRSVNIHFNHIDPQFFRTMNIPLLRGRNLLRGETGAIIVSDSLARVQWPAEDPVGKRFENDTVVGVSGSARLVSPEDSDAVEIYRLAREDALPAMVVLVKTSGPPEDLLSSVAAVARAVDPRLFPEVELLKSAFRRKLQASEYAALTVSVLGFAALFLACVGIVGLVAYTVSQRTKEIGIRMALGATPSQIRSVILRQFARPMVAGLLMGIGGAAALSQILRRALFGVSHLDPLAYLAGVGIFVVTVAFAALWPARRALRLDPMRALRYE
jgi:predicted permease